MKRITVKDILSLKDKFTIREVTFAIEYSKDWNLRRAAKAAGLKEEAATKLRDDPKLTQLFETIMEQRLEAANIDAEWLLHEAVDNHMIGRATGKLSASNTALMLIARHASVDALSAEKVQIDEADAVRERLQRGRLRNAALKSDGEESFL